ncbi:uncharacterized protein LOC144007951 isoform X1 [Festucalex cinctus]
MINERSSPEPGSTCRIGSFGAVRTCSKNTQGLSRAADAILHLLAKMNSSIDRCASRRADKAGPAYTAIDSMMEGEMEEKVTTEMTSCDHWLLCIRSSCDFCRQLPPPSSPARPGPTRPHKDM